MVVLLGTSTVYKGFFLSISLPALAVRFLGSNHSDRGEVVSPSSYNLYLFYGQVYWIYLKAFINHLCFLRIICQFHQPICQLVGFFGVQFLQLLTNSVIRSSVWSQQIFPFFTLSSCSADSSLWYVETLYFHTAPYDNFCATFLSCWTYSQKVLYHTYSQVFFPVFSFSDFPYFKQRSLIHFE